MAALPEMDALDNTRLAIHIEAAYGIHKTALNRQNAHNVSEPKIRTDCKGAFEQVVDENGQKCWKEASYTDWKLDNPWKEHLGHDDGIGNLDLGSQAKAME